MKVGIIGLGHGKRVLFDAFTLSNLDVYGVASKNKEKARKFSKQKKSIKSYKNWIDMIEDQEIAVIAIAVPACHQIKIITLAIYIFRFFKNFIRNRNN